MDWLWRTPPSSRELGDTQKAVVSVNRPPRCRYCFERTQFGDDHERRNPAYGDEYLGETEQTQGAMLMNDVFAEGRIATKDHDSAEGRIATKDRDFAEGQIATKGRDSAEGRIATKDRDSLNHIGRQ